MAVSSTRLEARSSSITSLAPGSGRVGLQRGLQGGATHGVGHVYQAGREKTGEKIRVNVYVCHTRAMNYRVHCTRAVVLHWEQIVLRVGALV